MRGCTINTPDVKGAAATVNIRVCLSVCMYVCHSAAEDFVLNESRDCNSPRPARFLRSAALDTPVYANTRQRTQADGSYCNYQRISETRVVCSDSYILQYIANGERDQTHDNQRAYYFL